MVKVMPKVRLQCGDCAVKAIVSPWLSSAHREPPGRSTKIQRRKLPVGSSIVTSIFTTCEKRGNSWKTSSTKHTAPHEEANSDPLFINPLVSHDERLGGRWQAYP
ncbi:hypothetical protein KM043_000837 [Ampulex compressa]|nr:hypothetical protein KM043_000837 [Ampulex compressa]